MTSEITIKVQKAAASLRAKTRGNPEVGIILGSGLSNIAKSFGGQEIPYEDIEGFPLPTVEGHKGLLYWGANQVVFAGRFHFYEGHSMDTVVLPVLTMVALGIKKILLTNAAGGIHYSYRPGDLVLLSDHLNLQGHNPLIGPHHKTFGPRFPDMSSVYSERLRTIAKSLDPALKEGVYAALSGPSYETPAEIRYLRTIGADLVGMSTVPEAIVAHSAGLEVLALSVVTNPAAGLGTSALNHAEVVQTGKLAEARLQKLLKALTDSI